MSFLNRLLSLFMLAVWISGFILAKGFWATFFCIIPFWSWYIVIEHLLVKYAII